MTKERTVDYSLWLSAILAPPLREFPCDVKTRWTFQTTLFLVNSISANPMEWVSEHENDGVSRSELFKMSRVWKLIFSKNRFFEKILSPSFSAYTITPGIVFQPSRMVQLASKRGGIPITVPQLRSIAILCSLVGVESNSEEAHITCLVTTWRVFETIRSFSEFSWIFSDTESTVRASIVSTDFDWS